MPASRIPKQLLYGQLAHGNRNPGGQKKRYKDQLRCSLKACGIQKENLEQLAEDRSSWRSLCHISINNFEAQRSQTLDQKRSRRHQTVAANIPPTQFVCDVCQRNCHSHIGLYAQSPKTPLNNCFHQLTTNLPWIRRYTIFSGFKC